MTTVATRPNFAPPPRKWWTRSEYKSMMTLGLLEDGGPFELIEGEVVEKMSHGRRHATACLRVTFITQSIFGNNFVQSQLPIAAGEFNEPEPDIAVLRNPADGYVADAPGPDDVVLVVEISDTSLQIDRNTKTAMYARAGIADYWVMDVNRRLIYQYRTPGPNGYASITTFTEAETISPLAAPEQAIPVRDLLPPQEA